MKSDPAWWRIPAQERFSSDGKGQKFKGLNMEDFKVLQRYKYNDSRSESSLASVFQRDTKRRWDFLSWNVMPQVWEQLLIFLWLAMRNAAAAQYPFGMRKDLRYVQNLLTKWWIYRNSEVINVHWSSHYKVNWNPERTQCHWRIAARCGVLMIPIYPK